MKTTVYVVQMKVPLAPKGHEWRDLIAGRVRRDMEIEWLNYLEWVTLPIRVVRRITWETEL